MEAARTDGGGQKAKAKPRLARTVRWDGREPMGLEPAISALVTERTCGLPPAASSPSSRPSFDNRPVARGPLDGVFGPWLDDLPVLTV